MSRFNNLYRTLLVLCLFIPSISHSASIDFFEDEDVIWKSGFNSFTYRDVDVQKYGVNDHPVELREDQVANALDSMRLWKDGFFSDSEDAEHLFSPQTTDRLSKFIVKGLQRARENQDIFFTVQSMKSKLVILKQKYASSGRVFYRDGKLNIIMGDYQVPINDALVDLLDQGDTGATTTATAGLDKANRKSKVFGGFDSRLIKVRGIDNQTFDNKLRKDWFVINVPVASDAWLAELKERQEAMRGEGDKQLEREAAMLARQRREMRAEMARMRKQIDAMENGGGQSSGASVKSIEERMATLDALLAKKLITQAEYDAKRQEILNDI